jgi:hypothetical protein
VLIGLAAAHELGGRLNRERVRPFVLILCTASAIVLLLEELL